MILKNKNHFKILVVEDNPGDFILISDYLKEQISDLQITHAINFKETKSILTSSTINFDIILLDLSLPDLDGEKLIEEIFSIKLECPVIVLTGYSDIKFSIKSLSLGVADYLLKDDISSHILFKSIIYCIERRKAILQIRESEKRYSDIFRLNPQPMWIYDPETLKFIQVNKAAIELYGYSNEEFLGMTVLDIRIKEDETKLESKDPQSLKERAELFKGIFKHCKKSKEIIEVEIYSNTVTLNDKKYKLVIASDVTEKNLFEHNITRAIIKTQEDERYEIGAELHDNVCQLLATSHISLGMLKESLNPSAIQLFNQCREYINLATAEIRNLSHRLAPAFFNDSTLEEAFDILLSTFNIEDKYKITLFFDKSIEKYNINRDLQLNLYRILQEQLRNILKYAKGTEVGVDVIINNNKLKMRISDNGKGFDIEMKKGGIGLANMRRRAELFSGKFEINSSPGNGCEILIEIPLPQGKKTK